MSLKPAIDRAMAETKYTEGKQQGLPGGESGCCGDRMQGAGGSKEGPSSRAGPHLTPSSGDRLRMVGSQCRRIVGICLPFRVNERECSLSGKECRTGMKSMCFGATGAQIPLLKLSLGA